MSEFQETNKGWKMFITQARKKTGHFDRNFKFQKTQIHIYKMRTVNKKA